MIVGIRRAGRAYERQGFVSLAGRQRGGEIKYRHAARWKTEVHLNVVPCCGGTITAPPECINIGWPCAKQAYRQVDISKDSFNEPGVRAIVPTAPTVNAQKTWIA